MPELPDVEIFRIYIEDHALSKKVKSTDIKSEKMVHTPENILKNEINGHAFTDTRRIGKYCFAKTNKDQWLVMHFGMTGGIKYLKHGDSEPHYGQIFFRFENDDALIFTSRRKSGNLELASSPEIFAEEKKLGPDTMEISKSYFKKILRKKNTPVKSALMSQENVASIGNIYSDEILYHSKIYPGKNTNELSDHETDDLFSNMKKILKVSIGHGADPQKLPAGYLIHARQEGTDCLECNGKIVKKKIAGRSSYFCPDCQTE